MRWDGIMEFVKRITIANHIACIALSSSNAFYCTIILSRERSKLDFSMGAFNYVAIRSFIESSIVHSIIIVVFISSTKIFRLSYTISISTQRHIILQS